MKTHAARRIRHLAVLPLLATALCLPALAQQPAAGNAGGTSANTVPNTATTATPITISRLLSIHTL